MKNIKFLYLALVALVAGLFTSCEQSDWTPGEADPATAVYFSEVTNITVEATDTEYLYPVYRNQAGEAMSAPVKANDESGLFTVASTAEFAAGELAGTLKITFDASQLELGVSYPIELMVTDEAYKGSYGQSQKVINISLPEPWNNLGEGIYYDDFFCNIIGTDPGYGCYVEFQQHALNPNRYRVLNAFGPETIGAVFGGVPGYFLWDDEPYNHLELDATDPDHVLVYNGTTEQDTDYLIAMPFDINFTDGPARMYMGFMDVITFKDGIFNFPVDNLYLLFPAEEEGKLSVYAVCNASGYHMYVLPGVEIADYSILAEYAGMKVSADNSSVKALINVYTGADVASFRYAALPGSVAAAEAAAQVVDGTVESMEGSIDQVEYELDLTAGTYTLVAVPYNAEGEAQPSSASVVVFYFPGMSGGDMPTAEIKYVIGSVADLTGEAGYEANYPASTVMAIGIIADAAELTGIQYFVSSEEIPAEVTAEELLANGEDASDFIADIAEQGSAILVFSGMTPGTTYTIALGFDTIYGRQTFRDSYTTPGAAAAASMFSMKSTDTSYAASKLMPFVKRGLDGINFEATTLAR